MTLSQVWFSPVNRLTRPTHGYSRCSMPQLLELIALPMFNRSWAQDLTKRMASNNKKNNRSKTMKQRRLHNVKLNRKSNKDNRLRWRKKPDEKRPRRRNVDKSRLKRRKEEGSSKRSMKTNSKNSKCNSSKRWSRI